METRIADLVTLKNVKVNDVIYWKELSTQHLVRIDRIELPSKTRLIPVIEYDKHPRAFSQSIVRIIHKSLIDHSVFRFNQTNVSIRWTNKPYLKGDEYVLTSNNIYNLATSKEVFYLLGLVVPVIDILEPTTPDNLSFVF
jgi:hypothetical protein